MAPLGAPRCQLPSHCSPPAAGPGPRSAVPRREEGAAWLPQPMRGSIPAHEVGGGDGGEGCGDRDRRRALSDPPRTGECRCSWGTLPAQAPVRPVEERGGLGKFDEIQQGSDVSCSAHERNLPSLSLRLRLAKAPAPDAGGRVQLNCRACSWLSFAEWRGEGPGLVLP